MSVATTQPQAAPEAIKKPAVSSTFVRVARYSVLRLLTLFVTVVIGIFLISPLFIVLSYSFAGRDASGGVVPAFIMDNYVKQRTPVMQRAVEKKFVP